MKKILLALILALVFVLSFTLCISAADENESTDTEGDTTAMYISRLLRPFGVKVTRLAFGLPADSGIAYSDPLTLRRAIANRIGC